MPTIYKARLAEPETPMLEIWNRMFKGLVPNARAILDCLGYYAERDLQVHSQESELTQEEEEELKPIARALMEAAIKSVQMSDGVLVSTLNKVAKNPTLFFEGQLPAAVQWEMAIDYQRGEERPGTFCLDIWGDEQTICAYSLETPTEASIKRAAEAALRPVQKGRRSGRPRNQANPIIAHRLGTIYRSSGHKIIRRWQYEMSDKSLIQVETGPFYYFLELVLPPLNLYLREQGRPPVAIESVVRLVTEEFS
jgi:hypothetical protein